MDTWVPVAGHVGYYEVSDSGFVRSIDRNDAQGNRIKGRVLRPDVRPSGHFRVTLCRESRTHRFWVHRLVLEAFVGPRSEGLEACHNDGDPTNNAVANLRWDTKSANAQDRIKHGTDAHARNTHCPHGHEYTAENIYRTRGEAGRRCRTCILAGQLANRLAQKKEKVLLYGSR